MDWMKTRPVYFLFSATLIALSLLFVFKWGFKTSIDFTGGTTVEYKFQKPVSLGSARDVIFSKTKEAKGARLLSDNSLELRLSPQFSQSDAEALAQAIASSFGERPNVLRFETVGPAFSQEILKKTYTAVVIASTGILFLVAWQFKNIRFGFFAIVALIHDLTILLGTFALLGHFKGVETDVLVITAFLTTLSLSLYDTVVVYDRIRESSKRFSNMPFLNLANKAVTETVIRSLNTSLATAFVLVALFLLGGVSIKWFVFALLVGVITGTYSSPFVAVALMVTWDQLRSRSLTLPKR